MKPGQGVVTNYGERPTLARRTGVMRSWAARPASDRESIPLGSPAASIQVGSAWRPSELESGRVVTVASNFGTMGSVPRRAWTPTINPPGTYSGSDPRLRAWNELPTPGGFNRQVNTAVATASAAAAGQSPALTEPMVFASPGVASLMKPS